MSQDMRGLSLCGFPHHARLAMVRLRVVNTQAYRELDVGSIHSMKRYEMSRNVVVTGATSGIGEACVDLFAAQGAHILGLGRTEDKLAALKHKYGDRFTALHFDLVDADASEIAAQVHEATGGELHGLVNGAGIITSGSIEETSNQALEHMLQINLVAPFALTRELLPQLRRAEDASIVNISSVSGLRPYPNLSSYCISKAALDQMTRCMAIELAPEKIRVNAINPGVVVSQLHRRGGMDEAEYEAFLERGAQTHPIGRVGQVDEIAKLIAYLLSEDAGWMTGETISIDGGRHLTSAR